MAQLTITVGNQTVCEGDSIYFTQNPGYDGTYFITGQTGSTYVEWTFSTNNDTFTTPNLSLHPDTDMTVYLRVTDDGSGEVIEEISVDFSKAPEIADQTASPLNSCEGEQATLMVDVDGDGGYQWQVNTGSGWTLANTGNYEGFGNKELTIKELTGELTGAEFRCVITGCARDDGHSYGDTTDVITVELGSGPNITTQPTGGQFCPGFEEAVRLDVDVSSGDSLIYQWYRDGSTVSGAIYDTLTLGIPDETNSGDYYVEITSTCGTATSETVTVGVYDAVSASASLEFSGDSIFADSSTVVLEADGGASYTWSNGDVGSQITISPATTGSFTYYVTATSSVGCSDTASVSFTAYQKPLPPPPVVDTTLSALEEYDFPNVFSPNNDGRNDYFIIKADNTSPLLFRVFNRYGAVIYETESLYITWDGHAASGELVSPGTYYYSVETTGFSKIGMIAVFH